jgi:hypothetical protein
MTRARLAPLWRPLLLLAVTLWTGGLTFYAAFVIHTAAAVLGSESTVGFITQRVTNDVNILASIALPLLLIDHLKSPPNLLRRLTLLTWSLLATLQLAMISLHPFLDRLLHPADFSITEFPQFHLLHKIYLCLASAQILTFPLYLGLLVTLWQQRDRSPTAD